MLPDGVPCKHAGCLSHISHPCEGCGRIGGRTMVYLSDVIAMAESLYGDLSMGYRDRYIRNAGLGELVDLLSQEYPRG